MIRQSVLARQQLRDSIHEEIAERIQSHQAHIARLRAGADTLHSFSTAAPAPRPLVLLAHGDSWFDYPLTGNGLPMTNTDVIAQLSAMGRINPVILNLSHHGDATTDEMSVPKQQRMIEALRDGDNWLNADKPDAILFSGGGNDIAGNQFCIFLDYASKESNGLDEERFQGVLEMVRASYRDLFLFRDVYAPGVPIIGHCYDFPIPNGVHPPCAGPWLKPSLEFAGWTDSVQGRAILREALTRFKAMLASLAQGPANQFTLVSTQGTLLDADWANELHPVPDGFKKIAQAFLKVLQERFPGGI